MRSNAAQELAKDIIIQSHLDDMQNTMLEHNLLRVLEPFSRVEARRHRSIQSADAPQIDHVAKIINLPRVRTAPVPPHTHCCRS